MDVSEKPEHNSGKIVAVAAFAAFLATFNETFLNIGFTPIMNDLGVGVSTVQWLATGYMLGAAVMVPVSAFAYRRIPTKPLFLATVSLLVVGSVIGALSTTFPLLLISRLIQSLGTGMLIPIGMNITLEVAPKNKLGTYMGIMGAMTTLGPSLSVILAGVILSFAKWNMLLWVFGGLSALLFICGFILLGNIAKLTKPRLDVFSVILIGLALTGILYGISTIFTGSVLIAILAIIIGGILLAMFVGRQKKLSDPLINLTPLSVKPFTIGVIINMLSLIVIFAMNIIMPIFMQSTKGSSSFGASLTLFPAILLSCVIAPVAGKICDKYGIKVLLPLGFICISVFTAALGILGNASGLVLIAILYIPVICGSALIIGPVQSFALSKLSPELNPHGVTVMSTGFQIAGCIGASVFTGIYSLTLLSKPDYAFTVSSLLATVMGIVGISLAFYISLAKVKKTVKSAQPQSPHSYNLLQSIMKTDVYSINPGATLLDALSLIIKNKISGMPVIDDQGKLCGFISDGDIMRHLTEEQPLFDSVYSIAAFDRSDEAFENKIKSLQQLKVSDVAVNKIISFDINDDLQKVCNVLRTYHLKKAPVTDGEKVVGIINRSSIIKYATLRCLEAAN